MLYFLIQILFIFLFPLKQHSDALWVFNYAKQFSEGDFSSLNIGNYLNIYPNNIGTTLTFAALFSVFPKSYFTIRIFNAILSTITMLFIYKIYTKISINNEKKSYGILIILLMYIPAIIMNNHTYNDVTSTTFCTIAVYYALKFCNTSKFLDMIITILALVCGNFVRQSTLLFACAIFLYWFIVNLKKNNVYFKKLILGLITIIFIFNLPLNMFNYIAKKNNIINENIGSKSFPIVGWINIGIPDDKQIGYWKDDARNTKIFKNIFNYDKKVANNFFIEDSFEKIKNTGYLNILKGYTKKTFWVWNEGTYQVNYFGFDQHFGGQYYLYKTPVISLAKPGAYGFRSILGWLLHSLNWFFLFCITIYLLYAVINRDFSMQLFFYIISAFLLFYIVWEMKSRYLFQLYPFQIIIVYFIIEKFVYQKYNTFSNLIKTNIKKIIFNNKQFIKPVKFTIIILFILISITLINLKIMRPIDSLENKLNAVTYKNNKLNIDGDIPVIINDSGLKFVIDTSKGSIKNYKFDKKLILVTQEAIYIKTNLKEQTIKFEKLNMNISMDKNQIEKYFNYLKYFSICVSSFLFTVNLIFIVSLILIIICFIDKYKKNSIHINKYYLLILSTIVFIIFIKIIFNPLPGIINLSSSLISDL